MKDSIKAYFQRFGLDYREVADIIGKTPQTVCIKVRKNSFTGFEMKLINDYIKGNKLGRYGRPEKLDEIDVCRAFGLLAS
jgi:predicted transcriptional regulator